MRKMDFGCRRNSAERACYLLAGSGVLGGGVCALHTGGMGSAGSGPESPLLGCHAGDLQDGGLSG